MNLSTHEMTCIKRTHLSNAMRLYLCLPSHTDVGGGEINRYIEKGKKRDGAKEKERKIGRESEGGRG